MTQNNPRNGAPLGKLRLYMSMSVDGFITGPDDGPGSGLGRGGERLHAWLSDGGVDPESSAGPTAPTAAGGTTVDATGKAVRHAEKI
jgi:hypothetical protein